MNWKPITEEEALQIAKPPSPKYLEILEAACVSPVLVDLNGSSLRVLRNSISAVGKKHGFKASVKRTNDRTAFVIRAVKEPEA